MNGYYVHAVILYSMAYIRKNSAACFGNIVYENFCILNAVFSENTHCVLGMHRIKGSA